MEDRMPDVADRLARHELLHLDGHLVDGADEVCRPASRPVTPRRPRIEA
jgi:hypothetical protein